ncbi:ADP-ribosyl cyclase/cyclic ADP-ribose hydrolase [Raphanus sativus]|nr:ADP-ribosyl cyclase/cyclic ADP-ribose hydrolase [Raphanus sativus]
MSENDFVSIPDSVVQQVEYLCLRDCRELESLPELPDSLSELYADNCVSLERLSQSSRSPHCSNLGMRFYLACVVLPPGDKLDDVPFRSFQISCYVRGRHSTTAYKWPEINVDESNDQLRENHLFILNSYFTLEADNIPESEMLFDFRCLGMKVYSGTIYPPIYWVVGYNSWSLVHVNSTA